MVPEGFIFPTVESPENCVFHLPWASSFWPDRHSEAFDENGVLSVGYRLAGEASSICMRLKKKHTTGSLSMTIILVAYAMAVFGEKEKIKFLRSLIFGVILLS